jgi:hypothetical protein
VDRNEILWRGRPSLWEVSGTIGLGVLLSPALVGFLILFSGYLKWRGTLYTVTATTAKTEMGMFVTSTRELRVSDIRSIEVRRSGLAGFFAIGDVVLSSSARDDATLVFGGIPATEVVANLVRDLQDGRSPGQLREVAANDSPFLIFAVLALIVSIPVWLGFFGFISKPEVSGEKVDAVSTAQSYVKPASTDHREAVPAEAPAPTPPSAAFLADVRQSQRVAMTRYPALAVKGSPMNARFLALYNDWQATHDPRLTHSNWPEILADECAANP